MRILLIGAYGLIGSQIARRLKSDGHDVVGLGRNIAKGRRLLPWIEWRYGNLTRLQQPEDWYQILSGIDVIINASGALQTGLSDDLDAVQHKAIVAVIKAAEARDRQKFIQISAPSADPAAPISFLRTKGMADAALRQSSLSWVIFKPGLVLSPNSYGGTSLLRMLAAVPFIQPLCAADAKIQTVSIDDICAAVSHVLQQEKLWQRDYELLEESPHALANVVAAYRQWLGYPAAKHTIRLPAILCHTIAGVADMAGWLGWRSPLRTTTLKVLADGVTGSSAAWTQATGLHCRPLEQSLADMPATQQERIFAGTALLFPVGLTVSILYWLWSGLVGLAQIDTAAALLPVPHASLLVRVCSWLDILTGSLMLLRKTVHAGLTMAFVMSVAYLVGGSILTSELWMDPIGPLVKIIPVIMLTLYVRATLQDR